MKILLLFTSFIISSISWGPLTHQTFPCFINKIGLEKECFQESYYYLTLGNTSPDSVKYLEPKLHTFEYATYQYLYSKLLNQIDFIQFSLGYAYHLCQDLIGHYKNSYLNPEYNRWIQIAIDSKMILESKPNSTIFKYHMNNAKGIQFLYDSNIYYSKINSNYIPHSLLNITDTIKAFEKVISLHYQIARVNFNFKDQMKQYDACKPQNMIQVENNFKKVHQWSIEASNYFRNLLNENIPPNRMDSLMNQFVFNLFKNNNNTYCDK